jgi:hypothetical protein
MLELPDFSRNKLHGRKIYQMATKCTNWPQNVPNVQFRNGHKICQHFSLQGLQKYTHFWFWYANIPSGNPDVCT